MMKYFSHLNTATRLIQEYRGKEPLHHFLKSFFSQDKKFGSKDRKRISHLCYIFYRVGRALNTSLPPEDEGTIHRLILAGLFLCDQMPDELLGIMKPEWNEKIAFPISEKTNLIRQDESLASFDLYQLFPTINELSEGINRESFNLSHLQQPDLFIRIRPGNHETVINKLKNQEIDYEFIPVNTVRLPNGFKAEIFFEIDKEIVVQDLNSQRIGEFLEFAYRSLGGSNSKQPVSVWDCCAASGGKSILVKDVLDNVDLTVSDVRESILTNLNKRFRVAGINQYKSFVADLSNSNSPLTIDHLPAGQAGSPFDLIIADLPCTGSGTWGRTPEQLYFFDPSTIEKYSQLQMKIAANIISHLKEKGQLLYVTCSVFEKENEEVIRCMLERFPLKVEKMKILKGYDKKADTMFAALLSRLQ